MTIDPNYGHHESCACLRPGDNGCNCHKAYGFDTAEAMEESETTPPAHGDGEGDAWTYPNRNALIREVCEGLRGYRFDAALALPAQGEGNDGY